LSIQDQKLFIFLIKIINNKLDISLIDTVILAGGLGTRLRGVLSDKPKCMAFVNGRPFIDILLDHYIAQGLKRFIICVGYKREQVIQHLNNRIDCEIIFSMETRQLGTGGALKNAQGLIKSDPYIVLNGDSFIDINIFEYIKWFQSIVITKMINSKRYGNVNFDGNGLITSFEEKNNSSLTNSINAGVYLFKKNIINFSSYGDEFSLEMELFPTLIEQGISTYLCDGKFIDIGTEKSYQNAQLFFNK
jgi:NDP-sugar pyrophosphorylase family protein